MVFSRTQQNRRVKPLERASHEERTPETFIRLDRGQFSLLVLTVFLLTVGAYSLGKGQRADLPAETPMLPLGDTPFTAEGALPAKANSQKRQQALSQVYPPTSRFVQALSLPPALLLPSDPAERAKAQTHLQLQRVRTEGLNLEGADRAEGGLMAALAVTRPDAQEQGFTLQVSVFEDHAIAERMAKQIKYGEAPVRVRQVRTDAATAVYRVEVGRFESSEVATAFLKRFERDTGYSGVLVAL